MEIIFSSSNLWVVQTHIVLQYWRVWTTLGNSWLWAFPNRGTVHPLSWRLLWASVDPSCNRSPLLSPDLPFPTSASAFPPDSVRPESGSPGSQSRFFLLLIMWYLTFQVLRLYLKMEAMILLMILLMLCIYCEEKSFVDEILWLIIVHTLRPQWMGAVNASRWITFPRLSILHFCLKAVRIDSQK